MNQGDPRTEGGAATTAVVLQTEVPCPQCGAPLVVPHQVDTFACPWCGSALRPADGLRIHRLRQRPRLTETAAAEALRAWFAGPVMPRDMEKEAAVEVGGLRYFPFLRARRRSRDTAVPLAPLPLPEVADLARVAADFAPVPVTEATVDQGMLRDRLKAAAGDPEVIELLIEERAFYPVRYAYRGERYTAAVDAGAGRVCAERRPAYRRRFAEGRVALIVGGVLFGEALLVPGPIAKVAAVVASAALLYPSMRWAVERRG